MPPPASDRMRWSLFYIATYLTIAGIGMTFVPRFTLTTLFSNGDYDVTFVWMCGLFVIGLAGFVVQTIRYRLVQLYPTIIAVRVVFCAGYVVLYVQTRDPFFLSVLAIVGSGLVASAVLFAIDRRSTQ